jgi:GAF domain-containing protein
MSGGERARFAVSAGAIAVEDVHRRLLDSIVQAARAIFAARAASILLWDQQSGDLVFEAAAGEGGARLVGGRFPADQGIAGWVLVSGEPIVVEDVAADPRFARDVAERTGYVPSGLMASPLPGQEGPLGVLQVLDRPERARFSLRELDILGLFAEQAAVALELVQHARRARRALTEDDGGLAVLARLGEQLEQLPPARRDAVLAHLATLERVVGEDDAGASLPRLGA